MARILITVHPDHGHVVPTLAVASELRRRGHDVVYVTGLRTVSLAEGTGARVLVYDSRYRDQDFGLSATNLEYLMGLLLVESEAIAQTAATELADEVPDLIVYDTSVLFAGRTLAEYWGRPAVQMIPMFASNAHYSYLRAIGDTEGNTDDGPPPWIDSFLDELGALTREFGLAVGPAELWWSEAPATVVTMPRDLQPYAETFERSFHFVGPSIDDRSYLGEWVPQQEGLPTVLVSCGAVFNEHPELFRTCIEAFRDTEWHVVMTTGDAIGPGDLGDLPDNVEVHRWVAHLDVLPHASLAVTHGGMGTVLEALATATPVVVVPTSGMDRLTSLRLEELGLGVHVELADFDVRALRDALRAVTGPDVRERVAGLAARIRAAGGATAAADVIDDALVDHAAPAALRSS